MASPARATRSPRAPKRWCAGSGATDLPVALGFGISRPEHVAEVAAYADAAVVGSALVSVIAAHGQSPELIAKVEEYVAWLRGGVGKVALPR